VVEEFIPAASSAGVYICHKRGDKSGAVKYAVKSYYRSQFKRGAGAWLGYKLKYRAIKSLNHPNVVNTLDLIENDGRRYRVMEYIDGVRLDSLVTQDIPFQDENIIKLARGLASAFKYIVESRCKPFIFIDSGPHNIIVRADGSPCVIDIEHAERISRDVRLYAAINLPVLRRVYRNAAKGYYIRTLGKCALLMALAPTPKPLIYQTDKERLGDLKRRALARGYDEDLIGLAVRSVENPSAVAFADWERVLSLSASA